MIAASSVPIQIALLWHQPFPYVILSYTVLLICKTLPIRHLVWVTCIICKNMSHLLDFSNVKSSKFKISIFLQELKSIICLNYFSYVSHIFYVFTYLLTKIKPNLTNASQHIILYIETYFSSGYSNGNFVYRSNRNSFFFSNITGKT